MKKGIYYQLTKLNSLNILILEKLMSSNRIRFTGREISKHLESNNIEQITSQYFSEQMKKLVDMNLVIEEGKKPKYYIINPNLIQEIVIYVSSLQNLETKICKK